jgi:ERCC4-type nuclease
MILFCLMNHAVIMARLFIVSSVNGSCHTEMKIIIDTHETNAFSFASITPRPEVIFRRLLTGDYSIDGYESRITIERKSLPDLFGSTGNYRQRFEREFDRMRSFDYAALVIEADLRTIIQKPPEYSDMNPKAVFRTLLSWSMKYGVKVWPCPDRVFAEKTTFLLLDFWYRHEMEGRWHI